MNVQKGIPTMCLKKMTMSYIVSDKIRVKNENESTI